jgi:hypothetical protein
MSYDKPNRVTYLFENHDFGAGSGTHNIVGPKGKAGFLRDFGIQDVTETFTNDTTPGYIAIGTSSDADAYGDELDLATTAANSGLTVLSSNSSQASIDAAFPDRTIPADTTVRVTMTAPTGGTPAGIAKPYVVIDWQD